MSPSCALVAHGADVNALDSARGYSALHHAADLGLREAVDMLLEHPLVDVGAHGEGGEESPTLA